MKDSAHETAEPTLSELGRYSRSVSITVNLPALRHNLAIARKLSKGGRQFATVKADAYGHGSIAVAKALSCTLTERHEGGSSEKLAEPAGGLADGFAVVTLNEALELREAGIDSPILVLQGPQSMEAARAMLQHDLWPVIHDLQQYEWFRKFPDRQKLSAWLKIDTGMGRLGVQPQEATEILAAPHGVKWMGLLTHFACADEPDNPFTTHQISRFDSVDCAPGLVRSMANSAAVLAWPQALADWARPGIMLYGCNPLDRPLPAGVQLLPAMTVKAPLIAVKKYQAGSGIGYAQSWRCPEDMPIAYVAIGYRDGLPRVLDQSASVWINGVTCAIVGRVSMDSIAVDIRQVPTAVPGDWAEIWGEKAPVDLLAKAAGTINYELLTSIRGDIRYVTEG